MNDFLRGYVETALWAETDNADDSRGEPLDKNHGPEDIHPDTRARMEKDCRYFLDNYGYLIGAAECWQAGRDFWLTHNGHGAGFWDGDWGEEVGEVLTKAAERFGEASLYIGDDGKIHQA